MMMLTMKMMLMRRRMMTGCGEGWGKEGSRAGVGRQAGGKWVGRCWLAKVRLGWVQFD